MPRLAALLLLPLACTAFVPTQPAPQFKVWNRFVPVSDFACKKVPTAMLQSTAQPFEWSYPLCSRILSAIAPCLDNGRGPWW
jgi:hypothetical protein